MKVLKNLSSSRKIDVIRISLESFDDIAYYMISRATGITTLITVLCDQNSCFTIIPLGEGSYVYIRSPTPDKERNCRYFYIDDNGNLVCSQKPAPARTNLMIVRVKEVSGIST